MSMGVATAMALAAGGPAWAAGAAKPGQGNQAQTSQDDCQAQPDQKKSGKSNDGAGSMKKLDKCGGVLQPPDVNDPGLVKPAPETGQMPVIKPGQVPQQAPKQE
jgi:hypothetical protein